MSDQPLRGLDRTVPENAWGQLRKHGVRWLIEDGMVRAHHNGHDSLAPTLRLALEQLPGWTAWRSA